jgi:hypothetical protein
MNNLTTVNKTTALAIPAGADPLQAFADAVAPQIIVGKLLRCSKGDWLAGEVPVMAGQACIGFLVSQGPRGVAAYDRNEKSLGVFADVLAAAAAVEKSVGPTCRGSGCGE